MNIDEILTLVKAVSDSSLTSFRLEQGDYVLSLKKEKEEAQIVTVAAPAVPAAPVTVAAANVPAVSAVPAEAAASVPAASAKAVDEGESIGDKVILSPLVGTFYTSASPEAESFVKVGDTVKKGQVLGIVEAMKLMNEIESEYDGVIEAVLAENEEVVEYGQPLFRIR